MTQKAKLQQMLEQRQVAALQKLRRLMACKLWDDAQNLLDGVFFEGDDR